MQCHAHWVPCALLLQRLGAGVAILVQDEGHLIPAAAGQQALGQDAEVQAHRKLCVVVPNLHKGGTPIQSAQRSVAAAF